MTNEEIARVAHEANRAYCITIGDDSQPPWDAAPKWQKDSALAGVRFHVENQDAGPSGSHECWLKQKRADGWKYGEKKDPVKREHPCFVPYDDLPDDQKVKDALFVSVVRALLG